MLDIDQIETFYPENLRPFKRNLLREYLQYKILEVIYSSPYARDLCFMGGTAIRIVHSSNRFSEDLDFDNRSVDQEGLRSLTDLIHKRLSREGYLSEMQHTLRGAFRASIRIPEILFQSGLSRHRDEKLSIQVDAEPQQFNYTPETFLINRFDVLVRAQVVPVDLLLAQKLTCLFTRKRLLGRDFYDIIFLMARTKPHFDYIKKRTGLATVKAMQKEILRKCKEVDFKQLVRDVAPFLMNREDAEKIRYFPEYIQAVRF
jgi:predicted nucleotidyltransferase component of viral defense system